MSDNLRNHDENEKLRLLELIRRAGQIQQEGLPAFTADELADCITGSATPELMARYEEALLNSAKFRRQIHTIAADVANFVEAGNAQLQHQGKDQPASSKSPVAAKVVAVISSIAAVLALVLLLPTQEHSEWQLVDSSVAPAALLQSQTRGAVESDSTTRFASPDSAAISGFSRVVALDQGTIHPVLPAWIPDKVVDSIPLTFVSSGKQTRVYFYLDQPQEQTTDRSIWLLLFPSRQLQQMTVSESESFIDLSELSYDEAVAVVVFSTPAGIGHSSIRQLDFPRE